MHGDEAQLSQSSVCTVIKDVSEAFARKREQFMGFPTSREKVEATQQQFYQYSRLSGVLGAIDGTHLHLKQMIF